MKADIALVATHADDPAENVWFGSVGEIALAHGLPVETPADVNAATFVERVRALRPDVLLSCYFRQILGRELLAIPTKGAYNMHGSLLPRFRGRAPVNWVLVQGERVTGVTLHHMDEKPDRGDIVGQITIPIDDEDTALTLHRKCARAAGELLRELWPRIEAGTAPRIPQDPARASYYGRRRPEDGRIEWGRTARECWNLVRAVTHPYPGAFTHASGRKLYVWKAAVLDEAARTGHEKSRGRELDPGEARHPDGARPADRDSGSDPVAARPRVPDATVSRGLPSEPDSAPEKMLDREPGTIVSVVAGKGFAVATGLGALLVERAQLEGNDEVSGEDLIRCSSLAVGEKLD
jgi:methionyl-tRNA formyltransferase